MATSVPIRRAIAVRLSQFGFHNYKLFSSRIGSPSQSQSWLARACSIPFPSYCRLPTVVANHDKISFSSSRLYSTDSFFQYNNESFNEMAWEGIIGALDATIGSKHKFIESEHLMKALLEQKDGLAIRILTKAGLDNYSVLQATDNFIAQQPKVRYPSFPILGSHLSSLLENARKYKTEFGDEVVSVEHLVLAFLSDQRFGMHLLTNLNLSEKSLKDAVKAATGSPKVAQFEDPMFQPVFCDQPSVEETISILRGLREQFELHHGVKISDDALVSAAVLSDRYITERSLPDKAIDLLDESAAKLKIDITSKPTELDQLDRVVSTLEMERLSLESESDEASKKDLTEIERELESLKVKQKELNDRLEREKLLMTRIRSIKDEIDRVNQETEAPGRAADLKHETLIALSHQLEEAERNLSDQHSGKPLLHEEVTDIDIVKIVSKQTGISLSDLQQSERDKLMSLEHVLLKRVTGQDKAVKSVADALRRSVPNPNKPIASFMFMGPRNSDKIEVAKALATHLFNTEKALVRINVSEYMEINTASQPVVEGDKLTKTVHRRPFSVVLIDDIEKAHHNAFKNLVQLLDDGWISDSQGRTFSFPNSIIIMPSSIASQYILETCRGTYTGKAAIYDVIKRQAVAVAKQTFSLEFINRIDELVVFQPPEVKTDDEFVAFQPHDVEIQLSRVQDKLDRKKMKLCYSKEAVDVLSKKVFETRFGPHPMKRVIHMVENKIATGILQGDFNEHDTLFIDTSSSTKDGIHIIKVEALRGM